MPKILAQVGVSLADVYDVEGSIAGTDELLTRDVGVFHEMGGQILSERLNSAILRVNPGGLLQSVNFESIVTGLPDSPNRIQSVSVVSDFIGRLSFASLQLRAAVGNREIPIWSWDSANDVENQVRITLDGGAISLSFLAIPGNEQMPYLLTRTSGNVQAAAMPHLVYRGRTTAFGAGTVSPVLGLLLTRPNPLTETPGEPSSHGLPIPSW